MVQLNFSCMSFNVSLISIFSHLFVIETKENTTYNGEKCDERKLKNTLDFKPCSDFFK